MGKHRNLPVLVYNMLDNMLNGDAPINYFISLDFAIYIDDMRYLFCSNINCAAYKDDTHDIDFAGILHGNAIKFRSRM